MINTFIGNNKAEAALSVGLVEMPSTRLTAPRVVCESAPCVSRSTSRDSFGHYLMFHLPHYLGVFEQSKATYADE